jgi:hypothetical protein
VTRIVRIIIEIVVFVAALLFAFVQLAYNDNVGAAGKVLLAAVLFEIVFGVSRWRCWHYLVRGRRQDRASSSRPDTERH